MSKIKCYNFGEYVHFTRDCPLACNNSNIAQESEQKGKSEFMLDLDSTSVSEKCEMVCKKILYEDASEDEVVYSDQGISTEEYEKATYADLMKTQSEEEEEVKCNVGQRANDNVTLERKKRRLSKENPNDVHHIKDFLKRENKKNSKEDNCSNKDEKKEGKQADLLRSKIGRYDHDIPRKKGENEKVLVTREMELLQLGRTFS